MESQVVKRRVNTIAGHFAANDDISATATHLFPMNCSSRLNHAIQRCDSRMYFARQGSSSQGFFMRPLSTDQNCSTNPNSVSRRCDNRLYFARQGSNYQGCFMRPVSTEQGSCAQSGMPLKCTGFVIEGSSNAFEAPLFSRPGRMETNIPDGVIQSMVQDCKLPVSASEPPIYARPNESKSGEEQFHATKKIQAFQSNGSEWYPRMDVADAGCNYVVTVELPGVRINDIRVEVDDKTLTVSGNRSTQWWKVTGSSNVSISAYQKKEILQGPYQVVWQLPTNVNKECVSAEFVDGFLRINIPKV